jgi:1-acyl-sn-glycerol-3-phosphate acyltransferase
MRGAEEAVQAWRHLEHPIWLYALVQRLGAGPVRFAFHVSARGFEKIPRTGPVILASNHASNIDPVLVVACLRRPLFHLGKHTLFGSRFGSWFLETLGGQIPVDRESGGNEDSLEAGLEVLQRGLALGIYPEGTRTPDGRLQPGRTGVALFAYLTGAPVFPVALKGTFETWPRDRRFPRLRLPTAVIVGDPITVPREPAAAQDPRRCRQLTDDIMTALGGLLGLTYQRSRISGPPARPSR